MAPPRSRNYGITARKKAIHLQFIGGAVSGCCSACWHSAAALEQDSGGVLIHSELYQSKRPISYKCDRYSHANCCRCCSIHTWRPQGVLANTFLQHFPLRKRSEVATVEPAAPVWHLLLHDRAPASDTWNHYFRPLSGTAVIPLSELRSCFSSAVMGRGGNHSHDGPFRTRCGTVGPHLSTGHRWY